MINIIITITTLLSGTIVASETVMEVINGVAENDILSTTDKSKTHTVETTHIGDRMTSNYSKSLTSKEFNHPMNNRMKDNYIVNSLSNIKTNTQLFMNSFNESHNTETMTQMHVESSQSEEKGSLLHLASAPNCRCKIFTRCVDIKLCLRKNNSQK